MGRLWQCLGKLWEGFVEALGISAGFDEAFGRLWQSLGRLWQGFGNLWRAFGEALGGFRQALGVSGEALARLWGGIEDAFGSFGGAFRDFLLLPPSLPPLYIKIYLNSRSTASAAPY